MSDSTTLLYVQKCFLGGQTVRRTVKNQKFVLFINYNFKTGIDRKQIPTDLSKKGTLLCSAKNVILCQQSTINCTKMNNINYNI